MVARSIVDVTGQWVRAVVCPKGMIFEFCHCGGLLGRVANTNIIIELPRLGERGWGLGPISNTGYRSRNGSIGEYRNKSG